MSFVHKVFLWICFMLNLYAFEGHIDEPIFNEQVYVKIHGNPQNETIVFVHGLGNEASSIWNETVEALKKEYYILTFDLSGFGKSSKSKQAYTITNYARLLFFLTNTYNLKSFYLVGHSMGGAIALKYASQNSTQVKKLMLIDTAGILHQEAYSKSLISSKLDDFFNTRHLNETNDSKIITFLSLVLNKVQSLFGLEDLVNHGTSQAVAAYSLGTEDFSHVIPKIKIDTFILWGENDTIAPKRTAYSLNQFMQNSKLVIVPNCGHVPMKEAFSTYIAYVKEFLITSIEQPQKNIQLNYYENVLVIENQKNKIIEGNYKQIFIRNSQNIVFKSAQINFIEIFNSSVHLKNCYLNSNATAGVIQNSALMITASNIFASTAFLTNSSRLDIAGTNFYTNNIIQNAKPTENTHILISISKQIQKQKEKILHGKYILTHSQSL